jgi:hypothetical protein
MGGGQVATLDKDSFAGSDWRSACLSVVVWLGRVDLVLDLRAERQYGRLLRHGICELWLGEQSRQLLEFDTRPSGRGLPGMGSGLPRELRSIRVVRSRGLDGGGSSCYPE